MLRGRCKLPALRSAARRRRAQRRARIEHWRCAMQQGRTAAHNMAGKSEAFTAVPFFWTTQFDATLRYVGHAKDWDEIILQGDLKQQDFLAFYVKDNNIRAVAGMNKDCEMANREELIRNNRTPSPDRLSGDSLNVSEKSRNF